MAAHRIEAVLEQDGVLHLSNIPFKAGARVEVVVTEEPDRTASGAARWERLEGSVLQYDDPTDPVAVEDWDALK